MPDSADERESLPRKVLDVRCAEEDPQEARHERHPRRQERREHCREHRRQRAGIAVAGEEADELHDHDQRARRRLRHAEPGQHLVGPQPVILLDRLLRDVGENRVRAAERDDGGLAEEEPDLPVHGVRAAGGENPGERREPQRPAGREHAQGVAERRTCGARFVRDHDVAFRVRAALPLACAP
jgi:hypothetical protein